MWQTLITFMVLALTVPIQTAHSQWTKLSISNRVPMNQSIELHLTQFNLVWGHFYQCDDDRRKKIKPPAHITIASGETVKICSTGAKMSPTGVEGTLQAMAKTTGADS